MREIKLIAFNKYNKVWLGPYTLLDLAGNDAWNYDKEVRPVSGNFSDYEWVEWTGLLDKNGTEIYEGDVVLLPDSEIVPITDEGQGPIEEMNHLCPVEFKEGCFGLSVLENSDVFHKGFWSFDSIFNGEDYKLEDLEIIGNIYESPELLKT